MYVVQAILFHFHTPKKNVSCHHSLCDRISSCSMYLRRVANGLRGCEIAPTRASQLVQSTFISRLNIFIGYHYLSKVHPNIGILERREIASGNRLKCVSGAIENPLNLDNLISSFQILPVVADRFLSFTRYALF